ncbi:TraB/GumN family protein [Winogradskyella alexanderae]|uniref:TraB/GumN family protein n=1 Tax=Winogradskyella alexanderae TaxID=2877123 RepID=A0ABS7XSV8_9FLAO|nr:TraB/GumN family protein [Winogradskyella alexanderae]MCA0133108.1 TraB/GumN family protein [Winogradskyella alexanderae]
MKKHASLIVIAFLSILSLNAQKLENSTLWKIEGNGLDKPSYLFGTIHITCDATLENDVLNALDRTTQIVLELDMDDPELQVGMMKGMYMKDGKTLKDLVSEEEYQSIDSLFIKNLGSSVKMMQNVKPFFLMSMLYPKYLDCPMQSFELQLMKIAEEQNEEIFGLETIEDQIQVFEEIPYEAQVKDLVRTAKDNLVYDKANFAKLLEVYKNEDITAMQDMMNDENYTGVAEYQNILLDNRNSNWIPKIKAFAEDQATFFGVGAGHLAGEKGVISLLKEEGYIVTPVREED